MYKIVTSANVNFNLQVPLKGLFTDFTPCNGNVHRNPDYFKRFFFFFVFSIPLVATVDLIMLRIGPKCTTSKSNNEIGTITCKVYNQL